MDKKKARQTKAKPSVLTQRNCTPPIPNGQTGDLSAAIRERQQILSIAIAAERTPPEAATHLHDLRSTGIKRQKTIHLTEPLRGLERRNVAGYSPGLPVWMPLAGRC